MVVAGTLEEKRKAKKSIASGKGPWGKIWEEVFERGGILIRGDRLVVPKALQAQAIAIPHEGHQQTDGTLRMLRQSQWFRNMQAAIKGSWNPACARQPTSQFQRLRRISNLFLRDHGG